MKNSHGLDVDYFSRKMERMLNGAGSYTREEWARECARMAKVADPAVLLEAEFVGEPAPFAGKVVSKLQRYQECTDDGQGADIGRHWFDLLTQLGLLIRVQRSPALWELSQQGEDLLEAERVKSAVLAKSGA